MSTATEGVARQPASSVEATASRLRMAGDPTRLKVLVMLNDREMYVDEMCAVTGMSQPALSHHIALMRFSGLIEPRRVGQRNYYALTAAGASLVRAAKAAE